MHGEVWRARFEAACWEWAKARKGRAQRRRGIALVWKACGCKRGIWAVGRGLWASIRAWHMEGAQ